LVFSSLFFCVGLLLVFWGSVGFGLWHSSSLGVVTPGCGVFSAGLIFFFFGWGVKLLGCRPLPTRPLRDRLTRFRLSNTGVICGRAQIPSPGSSAKLSFFDVPKLSSQQDLFSPSAPASGVPRRRKRTCRWVRAVTLFLYSPKNG